MQLKVLPGCALAVAAGVLALVHPTRADAQASPHVDQFNGSYTETVGFEVPGFRGITPHLAVSYGSSRRNGHVGVGWALEGFGVIERIGVARGTPRYQASDGFLLNGVELVACQVGSVSPSCTTGGTHSTKLETYERIRFEAAPNRWTVTAKDGTRTVYAAIQSVAAGTFRWGVDTVTDTSSNLVDYAWTCSDDCYPDRISYGQVVVQLYREPRGDVLTTATGVGLVTSGQRLKSVDVKVAGARLRAFRLQYLDSRATSRSLLQQVTVYDRDATVDAAGNVAGNSLPAPRFSYAGAAPALQPETWSTSATGFSDSQYTWSADVDGDGKTDIVTRDGASLRVARSTGQAFTYSTWEDSTTGWGTANNTWPMDVNADGKTDIVTYNSAGQFLVARSTGTSFEYENWGTQTAGWGDENMTWPADVDGNGRMDLVSVGGGQLYVARSLGDRFFFQAPFNAIAFGGAGFTWAVDANGDGMTDVVTGNGSSINVAVSTGTSFVGETWQAAASSWGASGFTWPGDVNGDGRTDIITASGATISVARSTGTSYVWETWTTAASGWGGSDFTWPADVNGDGKTDLVTADGSNLRVALSNGSSFAWSTWSTTAGPFGGAAFTWLVDANGDGMADLVTANGATISVARSTGTSFKWEVLTTSASGWGAASVTWLGWSRSASSSRSKGRVDVTGTGGASIVTWNGATLKVYRAYDTVPTGATLNVRDLLVRVDTALGGIRVVTYQPSTLWPNTAAPPPVQIVTKVIEIDGRGTSAPTWLFGYAGGLYDRAERRFLGFHYVKQTLPCIDGERACPYIETTFKQSHGSIAKPDVIRTSTGAGQTLTSSTIGYTENGLTIPYTSLETSRGEYVTDGDGIGRGTFRTTAYDGYGNVTHEVSYGDDNLGDEKNARYLYRPNTTAYIVNRPAVVRAFDGTGAATTPKLSETLYHYDGASSSDTPPTRGLITAKLEWLDTLDAYVTTRSEYDSFGNLTAQVDALGGRVQTEHDPVFHLYPTTITDPLGRTITQTFDIVCGVVRGVKDLRGQNTTTTLDGFCRPVIRILPGGQGNFESRGYANLGSATTQYQEVTTPGPTGAPNGFVRSYFDGLGRVYLVERTGGAAGVTIRAEQEYDARGNLRRQAAPHYSTAPAQWSTLSYDGLDRVVRVTHADQSFATRSYGFDRGTAVTTDTDELGRASVQVADAFGRLTERRELLDNTWRVTTYRYDPRGNLSKVVDPAGNLTVYTTDSLQRRTQVEDPDLGTWRYQLDALGRTTAIVDAKGQRVEHTYDPLSRRRTKTTRHASGTVEATVTWTYDEARTGYFNTGLLTSMTDSAGAATFDHDRAGRQVKGTRVVDGVAYTFHKAYDKVGRLLGTRFPDGDVVGLDPTTATGTALQYDLAGRLIAIPGIVAGAQYTADGQLTHHVNQDGTTTTRSYDPARGWLVGINTVKGATTLQNLVYTRSLVGQVSQVTSPFAGEGWSYGYDALDRLTAATSLSSTAHSQSFLYDAVGNLTLNSRVGTYAYPAPGTPRPHAVTTAGANSYQYDANGNLTSGGGRTIGYDVENRPVTINGAQYRYDGEGGRVKVVASGVTTIHLGDGYEVAAGVVTKHVVLGGVLIAKKTGATVTALHTDHLGSVQAMTVAGTLVQRITYRPYGERLATTSTVGQPRGFTGQEQDATGLLYLHARYYDPMLGRFLSPDPTIPSPRLLGLNRYAYAQDNPVNLVDLDGLGFWGKVGDVFEKGWQPFANIGALVKTAAGEKGQSTETRLRALGAIAIIGSSVTLTVLTGGISSPLAYVAANAAIGFATGAGTAAVMGASMDDALRAGLIGAAVAGATSALSVAYKAQIGRGALDYEYNVPDTFGVNSDAAGMADEGGWLTYLINRVPGAQAWSGAHDYWMGSLDYVTGTRPGFALVGWKISTGFAWLIAAGPPTFVQTYAALAAETGVSAAIAGGMTATDHRRDGIGASTLGFLANSSGEAVGIRSGGHALRGGGGGSASLLAIDPL